MTQVLRAQAWLVGEQPEKAKKALDPVLAEHPEVTRAWLLRARATKWLGDAPASLADYREVLKRSPLPEPDLVLEVAEFMVAQEQEKEAEQVIVAGMAKLGPVPVLVLRAMDLEIAAKNFDAALLRVEEMRKTSPRPEPWMAKRASILAQAGRIDESRAAWEALARHLLALPNLERGSHAMSKLMEETRFALDALASLSPPPKSAPPTPPLPPP
jgi:predicted Zn-dependent protease